jgi:hypothetical protein
MDEPTSVCRLRFDQALSQTTVAAILSGAVEVYLDDTIPIPVDP